MVTLAITATVATMASLRKFAANIKNTSKNEELKLKTSFT
jgi:hypothetical protein